jgi:hypothetical protein
MAMFGLSCASLIAVNTNGTHPVWRSEWVNCPCYIRLGELMTAGLSRAHEPGFSRFPAWRALLSYRLIMSRLA